MTLEADIQGLEPGALMEMFVLDATALGGTVYRFHAGVNGFGSDLRWQGFTYQKWPVSLDGLEWAGRGNIPRPTLTASNVTGLMSALALAYEDLVGATVTRKQTLAKYLDAANFTDAYVALPGANGSYLSTPDSVATSVTGDIDIRMQLSVVDWTPSVTMTLFAKGSWTSPMNPAYAINLMTTGVLKFFIGDTSSSYVQVDSTVATGFADGSSHWIRVTRVRSTGVVTYFTSADGVTWTQLGATQVLSAGTFINDSPSPTWIGNFLDTTPSTPGAQPTNGKIYYVDVRNGIDGTIVASMRPQDYVTGSTFTSGISGEVWTLNGSAAVGTLLGAPDPAAYLPDEMFEVVRKIHEHSEEAALELAPSFDVEGVRLPRRFIIKNICPFVYRDASTCSYAGGPVAKEDDSATSDPAQDQCGKRVQSCKLRFGANSELFFGGFPAVETVRG